LVAAANAAPGDRERVAIRRMDQARAEFANLRGADVPSAFHAVGRLKKPFGSPPVCGSYRPDLSDLTITGESASPIFASGRASIFATVQVFRSIRDERADWSRTVRASALPCVARQIEAGSTASTRIDVRSYDALPAPRFGRRALLYRFACVVTVAGQHVKMWSDVAAVEQGRSQASVVYSAYGRLPSAGVERALLKKLAQRLHAIP
jgi:hypothetical protein